MKYYKGMWENLKRRLKKDSNNSLIQVESVLSIIEDLEYPNVSVSSKVIEEAIQVIQTLDREISMYTQTYGWLGRYKSTVDKLQEALEGTK